jgi:hypothetical protein
MAAPNIPDDVAAEVGRAILTALARVSQRAPVPVPAPAPCQTCAGTGWVDVDPYVDQHGHVYPQVEPCSCGRVKALAA